MTDEKNDNTVSIRNLSEQGSNLVERVLSIDSKYNLDLAEDKIYDFATYVYGDSEVEPKVHQDRRDYVSNITLHMLDTIAEAGMAGVPKMALSGLPEVANRLNVDELVMDWVATGLGQQEAGVQYQGLVAGNVPTNLVEEYFTLSPGGIGQRVLNKLQYGTQLDMIISEARPIEPKKSRWGLWASLAAGLAFSIGLGYAINNYENNKRTVEVSRVSTPEPGLKGPGMAPTVSVPEVVTQPEVTEADTYVPVDIEEEKVSSGPQLPDPSATYQTIQTAIAQADPVLRQEGLRHVMNNYFCHDEKTARPMDYRGSRIDSAARLFEDVTAVTDKSLPSYESTRDVFVQEATRLFDLKEPSDLQSFPGTFTLTTYKCEDN